MSTQPRGIAKRAAVAAWLLPRLEVGKPVPKAAELATALNLSYSSACSYMHDVLQHHAETRMENSGPVRGRRLIVLRIKDVPLVPQ